MVRLALWRLVRAYQSIAMVAGLRSLSIRCPGALTVGRGGLLVYLVLVGVFAVL